jgi:hypothetical protein
LENKRWGFILVAVGVVGLILWSIGAEVLFRYLTAEVYHGDPGEPIWVLAPEYAGLVLLPGGLLLFGLCVLLFFRVPPSG